MNWLYEDKEFTDVEDYYGFIYLIENLINGKKYIGRKYLTKAGYKTVKGKRKKIRLESDWRDYYGSSTSLKEDVDHYGKDSFRRTILRLCKSRGECNYFETKYIFDTDAILDPQYYNNWVSCKIQASHVKALIFNPEQENL
mgnify:FL=1|jgi:hypothetical protein